jgi:hypothetical protein
MGFSGGGSNVLLPHTHDGRVAQDGGPLNFANITQSQSAAGEVFYSDGIALQQLAYPGVPAGETLTAAAASTAPSWVAPAPAPTSTWKLVAENTLGAPATSFGVFWPVADQCDYYQAWVFTEFSAGALARRYLNFSTNGTTYDTSAVYATRYSINFAAMGTATAGTGISSATGTLGNQFSCIHIQDATTTAATTTWDWAVTNSSNTGGTAPDQTVFTAGVYGNTANIRGINISDGGAGTTFAAGSSIIVVGLKLT